MDCERCAWFVSVRGELALKMMGYQRGVYVKKGGDFQNKNLG